MKPISMLDLKLEYEYMKEDIDRAIRNCLDHQKWILGPEVRELETKIASYLGVKHCIGVSSGTEALVLSLRALAISTTGRQYFDRTHQIITTPFTFTGTGDAILRAGATPVFVDIDPLTFNIDPARIRAYLTTRKEKGGSRVVGIIPVHLYGQSCKMDSIMGSAKESGLFVVEDTAQAFGASWQGRKLGSIGTAGCFSFFPSKNLGGFGDGGMVSTNDDSLAELLRMLIKHGGKDKYNVDHIGYNARLDTIQAAVLLAKFKYVEEFNEKRRKIARVYTERLSGEASLRLPVEVSDTCHAFHQYTISTAERNPLQKFLAEKQISTMVYYPFPLHKMKVFGQERSRHGDPLMNAERACDTVLSLPIEPLQDAADTERIIGDIGGFFHQK